MTITINKANVTIDGTPYAVPDADAPLLAKMAAALEAVVAGSDEQFVQLASIASTALEREKSTKERAKQADELERALATEKEGRTYLDEQMRHARIIIVCLQGYLVSADGALRGGNPDDDIIVPDIIVTFLEQNLKGFCLDEYRRIPHLVAEYRDRQSDAIKLCQQDQQSVREEKRALESVLSAIGEIAGADAEKLKENPSIVLPLVRLMAMRKDERTLPEPYKPALDEVLSYLSEDGANADETQMQTLSLRVVQALRWSQNAFYELAQAAGIPEYGTPADYEMLLGRLKQIVTDARMDAARYGKIEKQLARAKTQLTSLRSRVQTLEASLEEALQREQEFLDQHTVHDEEYQR